MTRAVELHLLPVVAVLIAAVIMFTAAGCSGGSGNKSGQQSSTPDERTALTTASGGTPAAHATSLANATPDARAVARSSEVAGAQQVLTQVAGGQAVPSATAEAARTIAAGTTPTPSAGRTTTATPGSTRTPAAPPAAARLSIDADPDNDGGPCKSIDKSRTVSTGDQFTIAICLEAVGKPPVNGKLNTLAIEIAYGTNIAGLARSDDGTQDLNGNPDFNDGADTGGGGWDCNLLDDPRSAPRAAPSPALIFCSTDDAQDRQLAGDTVLLAVVTMQAAEAGTAQLTFGARTDLLSGNTESSCPENTTDCSGASIEVR